MQVPRHISVEKKYKTQPKIIQILCQVKLILQHYFFGLKVHQGEAAVCCSGSLRRESVNTTGFHLQQTVLPVSSGDTEVMDGASQDAERFSLQSEVGRVGLQTLCTARCAFFRKIPGGQNATQRYNKQLVGFNLSDRCNRTTDTTASNICLYAIQSSHIAIYIWTEFSKFLTKDFFLYCQWPIYPLTGCFCTMSKHKVCTLTWFNFNFNFICIAIPYPKKVISGQCWAVRVHAHIANYSLRQQALRWQRQEKTAVLHLTKFYRGKIVELRLTF